VKRARSQHPSLTKAMLELTACVINLDQDESSRVVRSASKSSTFINPTRTSQPASGNLRLLPALVLLVRDH